MSEFEKALEAVESGGPVDMDGNELEKRLVGTGDVS